MLYRLSYLRVSRPGALSAGPWAFDPQNATPGLVFDRGDLYRAFRRPARRLFSLCMSGRPRLPGLGLRSANRPPDYRLRSARRPVGCRSRRLPHRRSSPSLRHVRGRDRFGDPYRSCTGLPGSLHQLMKALPQEGARGSHTWTRTLRPRRQAVRSLTSTGSPRCLLTSACARFAWCTEASTVRTGARLVTLSAATRGASKKGPFRGAGPRPCGWWGPGPRPPRQRGR